jgi:hypothetical protein
MLGFSKEKKEKPDKSREEKKEKVKKKLPPMKNKQSRPAKGQLPDPTFSQMKFAYRTTWADVDGSKTNSIGKKKASYGARLEQRVFIPFPSPSEAPYIGRRGETKLQQSNNKSQVLINKN